MLTIEMLDAYEGDALWIEYGESGGPVHRMLIDAGRKRTYREIAKRLLKLKDPLELFVMTHVDDDHIFGAVPLFADGRTPASCFQDVWYNGYTHLDETIARRPRKNILGPKNGEIFAALILNGNYRWNEAFDEGATVVVPDTGDLPVRKLDSDMRLTLLSPTWTELRALRKFWDYELGKVDLEPGDLEAAFAIFKGRRDLQPSRKLGGGVDVEAALDVDYEPDSSKPNGSSIAFLAEYGGRSVLFSGDAHPEVLVRSIERLLAERGMRRLALDAFKVSHHGSAGNTSVALLDLLECRRFLISTDGTRAHEHPHKEAIARIVKRNKNADKPTELYFNHRSDYSKVWDDGTLQDDWNYKAFYPPKGRLLKL